jgi:hypothetical protein
MFRQKEDKGLTKIVNGKTYHVPCTNSTSMGKGLMERRLNAMILADQQKTAIMVEPPKVCEQKPQVNIPVKELTVAGLKALCLKNNIDISGCKLRKDYENKLQQSKN